MTVFEYDGRLLIVDCGVLFPEDDQPGVDLILPDFAYIRDRLDDVEAIVLTHGHEDHIGARALPAARASRTSRWSAPGSRSRWSRPSCASTASTPYTLEVARGPDASGSGRSSCEFFAVNHSIPDALAVAIRTAGRRSCCTPATSRWTSCRSTAGSPTCGGFARLGDEGVDLLLADSTNAEVPGLRHARSARSARCSTRSSRKATGRIIVACFASHVHRVQQVLDAAARARPQGRVRRPVDGAQHGHRPRPRLPARPGRA